MNGPASSTPWTALASLLVVGSALVAQEPPGRAPLLPPVEVNSRIGEEIKELGIPLDVPSTGTAEPPATRQRPPALGEPGHLEVITAASTGDVERRRQRADAILDKHTPPPRWQQHLTVAIVLLGALAALLLGLLLGGRRRRRHA